MDKEKKLNMHPFRGILYHGDSVDQKKIFAPPYDLFEYGDKIDSELRQHQQNIVHIQKPLGEGDQKYRNALTILQDWIKQGLLRQDEKKCYYLYEQKTQFGVRRGIISAVDIDDQYNRIRRHEKIKSGPKIDRLKLTLATGLNVGLIFTVFKDEQAQVFNRLQSLASRLEPVYNFSWTMPGSETPEQNVVENRLFRLEPIDIQDLLYDKVLYIADGHHRYQTMIDYRNILTEHGYEEDTWQRTMIYAAPDANLLILGYPRLVRQIDESILSNLIARLQNDFDIVEKSEQIIPQPKLDHQISMFLCDGFGYLLQAKGHILQTRPKIINTEILQDYIFDKVLKIDQEMVKSGNAVDYANGELDIQDLVKKVELGNYKAAFVVKGTSLETLMSVSDQGQVMPQKSTYFYPKLLTGLVLNKVADPFDDLTEAERR